MKRPPFHASSAAIICILAFAGGCALNERLSPTQSAKTPAGTLQMFRPVSDVPIPKDAELDAERSLILSGKSDWTGRLFMISSVSATEAYTFFTAEMPRFEWSPIMTVQSAVSVLTFTRTGRAATVQIERRALGGSLITITVAHAQDTIGMPASPVGSPPIGEQQRRN
jgi:hypothetical protein